MISTCFAYKTHKEKEVHMKSSGIGGQAVLEGVMMRNKKNYAVAVRKPDGEIAVEKGECNSVIDKHKFLGIPIVRGVVNFVESLVLGVKMLTSSPIQVRKGFFRFSQIIDNRIFLQQIHSRCCRGDEPASRRVR